MNIYFIQPVTGGPVKIGRSVIQGMSPVPLRIVRVIKHATQSTERDLHTKHAAHRLHGEWFSEEVLNDLPANNQPPCKHKMKTVSISDDAHAHARLAAFKSNATISNYVSSLVLQPAADPKKRKRNL